MQFIKAYFCIFFTFSFFPIQSFADTVCDNLSYILPSGQWHQISLPCKPANNNVASVFGDDIKGTLGIDWNIVECDALLGTYKQLIATSPLSQKKGYWLGQLTGENAILDIQGTVTPGTQSIPLSTNPVNTTLNMVGYPFPTGQAWNKLKIITNTPACASGCTPKQAGEKQIIHDVLWHFNADLGQHVMMTNADTLLPWHAYWSVALSTSDNTKPKLNILAGQDRKPPANWHELNLSFNGISAGIDSTNKSLLLSLPAGFSAPKKYTAKILHNLEAQGFSLRIGGKSPINSGSSYTFDSIWIKITY
ncbi:MAG: hypothetical protein KAH20_15620 [Methylococcales bacterium]|nr:hypothetical protein [Methylococcales bacterium]